MYSLKAGTLLWLVHFYGKYRVQHRIAHYIESGGIQYSYVFICIVIVISMIVSDIAFSVLCMNKDVFNVSFEYCTIQFNS